MNRIDRLYMEMIHYYQGDPKHIQHFVKAVSYTHLFAAELRSGSICGKMRKQGILSRH